MCLLLMACVTPLMHPLRAGNGFVAEAATSLQEGMHIVSIGGSVYADMFKSKRK